MSNRRKPGNAAASSLKELHTKSLSLKKVGAAVIEKIRKLNTEIEAEQARRSGRRNY